jgi:hypothetical protein
VLDERGRERRDPLDHLDPLGLRQPADNVGQPRREIERFIDEAPDARVAPSDVDWIDVDVAEARALEQLDQTLGRREREHTRRASLRPLGVAKRHERVCRYGRPRIELRLIPDRERQPPAGPQHAASLVHRRLRIEREHQPPATQDRVDIRGR